MLQPSEKHPDSEEKPEELFNKLQSTHNTLSTEIQAIEQQLKAKRAEIINVAKKSNNAHPLLNKADEVWFYIFSHLPSKERAAMQKACMRFFLLGKDPCLPKFPLDYTATPKRVEIRDIPYSLAQDIDLFNLPLTNQFVLAEFIDESFEDESKQFNYRIHVVNSYTGVEEARFKIELPFRFISQITASETNQLIFVGRQNNSISFVAYDLQSRNKHILHKLDGRLADIKRLYTGQFAILYHSAPRGLHLLILQNNFNQQTIIDTPPGLGNSCYLYEIKTGNLKNHILVYDKHNFIIIDTEGVIKKIFSLNESDLPEYTSQYSEEIQEPKANELIFNYSSGFLHLNLTTGKHIFRDLKPSLHEWNMRKFLDRENILLVNYTDSSNQLIYKNCRTHSLKVIDTYVDKEFPYDTLTLNNGNLVVKIKHKESGKLRYTFYRFPEQQFIAQPIQHHFLELTNLETGRTIRSRPGN